MTTPPTFTYPPRRMPRELLIQLIRSAATLGHLRFARETCLSWLAMFPGDLPVNLIYAQLLIQEGQVHQALPILDRLCQTDPEYLEAYSTRLKAEARLRQQSGNQRKTPGQMPTQQHTPRMETLQAHIFALGGDPSEALKPAKNFASGKPDFVPAWSYQVREARRLLTRDNTPGQVEQQKSGEDALLLHDALAAEESSVLVAITHLRLLQVRQAPEQSLRALAEHYRKRWPDCLQFTLIQAHALMEAGEPDKAVALLHKAAARDVTGQVISRLWGDHHPYLALWPDQLAIDLDIAIPAAVAAALGWNQLPEYVLGDAPAWGAPQRFSQAGAKNITGEASAPVGQIPTTNTPPAAPTIPESLKSVQEELERVAQRLNLPGLASSDARFPVYVILTTRSGLTAQYGAAAANTIEQALRRLVTAVQARRDWHALLFLADRESYPGVKPARPNDAWSIKLALADLDAALARKGEMIGAVLIVGGPEIVPFHHLPNPVDDADDDVPSDNPYSTRDENYFIPEWSVGRLPGDASSDPGLLLQSLERCIAYHTEIAHRRQTTCLHLFRIWRVITWVKEFLARNILSRKRASLGYTAAAWRKASAIVFRPIGKPKALKVSPPLSLAQAVPAPLPPARLGYFNLHGLIDAVEWFGQSDPEEMTQTVNRKGNLTAAQADPIQDYPVALRPQDIQNSRHTPEVIFSEACYGGHIQGRTVEHSLTLQFLQAGSRAVVASTSTAYGSVVMPLIAADFLGYAFWSALRQGVPAGEALRRAKITLAREMHLRQGYLDGEDQKTLISFNLYGDPLALPLKLRFAPKAARRTLKPQRVKIICDRQHRVENALPVPDEVVAHAKLIVQKYLPGMADAEVHVNQEHRSCNKTGQPCPPTGGKAASERLPNRRVVVLSKQVANHSHLHRHYARITFDDQNRMVKLVVSR